MNEEEIIEECNKLFVTMTNVHINGKAMKDLLDLYKAEKEKNKELEQQYDKLNRHFIQNHVSKDKIKSLLNKNKKAHYLLKADLQSLLEEE